MKHNPYKIRDDVQIKGIHTVAYEILIPKDPEPSHREIYTRLTGPFRALFGWGQYVFVGCLILLVAARVLGYLS